MSPRKFRVGDRVRYNGHLATIMEMKTYNIDGVIRYDDHNLGWSITEEDHKKGYHPDLPIGRGYYWVDTRWIEFISRPRKRNDKPMSKTLEEANRAAIKEQVEQEEVIRLTNEFIQKLKEAWQ